MTDALTDDGLRIGRIVAGVAILTCNLLALA